MAIAPTVLAVDQVTVGTFVVSVQDVGGLPGGLREWASHEGGSWFILNGTALPSVSFVAVRQIQDAPGGPQKPGQYVVTLQIGTGDAVTVTSPQTLVLSPNATFLVNATAN